MLIIFSTIMKFLKTLLCSLFFALTIGTAQAASTDLGVLSYGETTFGHQSAKGLFIDTYSFVVPINSLVTYSVTNLTAVKLKFLALLDSDDYVIAFDKKLSAGELTFSSTTTGAMEILVSGNAKKNLNLYAGTISITQIPAVPEPETYFMFLAGLAVMGAIAYKKNIFYSK